MLPESFTDILNAPCFLLNLDRCIDRWPTMKQRIEAAGFKPQRISAIDGISGKCRSLCDQLMEGRPYEYAFEFDGKAGCTLSHVLLWEAIIQNNIPYASIFEDDVLFHKDWNKLAPIYYQNTNKQTDIIYYGSQDVGSPTDSMITQNPVFTTHAYLITLQGAKILLQKFKESSKLWVIDCFIIGFMKSRFCPFHWQCWNGKIYPDPARHTGNKEIDPRNDGLVYQDASYESNVHCQASST